MYKINNSALFVNIKLASVKLDFYKSKNLDIEFSWNDLQ